MGPFALYFCLKLWLHLTGYIAIHALPNLLLALFTALPTPNSRLRLAKNLVGWPLAVLLLYHDSYLPKPARAIEAVTLLRSFSPDYLLELAFRFFNPWLLVVGIVIVTVYVLAARKIKVGSFAILGLVLVWVIPASWSPLLLSAPKSNPDGRPAVADLDRYGRYVSSEALDQNVERFHAEEATHRIAYTERAHGAPFDIIILHVCSLSWDDLAGAKVSSDDFFSRFQIVLTQFNSAASYSGPAAIRLLRANCGQSAQKSLYAYPDRECLLFAGFEDAGYEPHWLMNHDGHFANFFGDVYRRGGLAVEPERNSDADVAADAFDGTPVYSDYDVLSRWWARRMTSGAERVALYYNTISLHDGNRLRSAPGAVGVNSYALRTRQLFNDLTRFMHVVDSSGRRAMIVLVAEHGAAVRGDRYQIDGLREIPSPAITEVPVAIAYVGSDAPDHQISTRVDDPVSYFGLAEILHRSIYKNPFDDSAALQKLADNLSGGPFVAENDDTLVVRVAGRYLMRPPGGDWVRWEGRSPQ